MQEQLDTETIVDSLSVDAVSLQPVAPRYSISVSDEVAEKQIILEVTAKGDAFIEKDLSFQCEKTFKMPVAVSTTVEQLLRIVPSRAKAHLAAANCMPLHSIEVTRTAVEL